MSAKPFASLAPFAIVPAAALQVLRPGLLATFMALASFASHPDQELDLTHAQIAKRRARSKHTVRKQLYELEDMGVIHSETVYRDGAPVCARYRIDHRRLLELAGKPPPSVAPPPIAKPDEEAPDTPEPAAAPSGDDTRAELAKRVEVLARAWLEVAGDLDLSQELLEGLHVIAIEDRHQDGRLKTRYMLTAADYIGFALRRTGAFTDIRRRWVTRAIRELAFRLRKE